MVDRSRLRQFMNESFNDDELADLIFDYFPNVRSQLGEGMTLGQKIRVLIDFADRHERMEHLVVVLEKLRPEAYCDFFQTDIALPPEPETARRNPHQVFISYANPDAEFAARLAADLRAKDIPVWLAPDSILPGEKWVAAIERGLRESGIFLLVLTPEGVESKWVSQETQVAIMLENEGQMRIFPLRVRRAEVPLLLSTRQHIAFDRDYHQGLAALLATLGGRPVPAPLAPSPLPEPAQTRPVITETILVASDMPVLIIDWPDQPNQEVTLGKASTTVGRAPDNDIAIDLPVVSGHHLRLDTVDEGTAIRVSVVDLGSRNGTFIGGRRLEPQMPQSLEPGDVIHLGDRIGRSISLILRPETAAVGNAALQRGSEVRAEARDYEPVAPPPLSKIPMWAYAAAGLLLVVLVAFFALRGRGERPASAAATPGGAATQVVVAARDEATDTAAAETAAGDADTTATTAAASTTEVAATVESAVVPTEASTDAATAAATEAATIAPTEAATTAPTETPTPTAELPTATPEAIALPTLPANFEISRANPLSFEALGEWLRDERGSRAAGTMTVSDEQARTGAYAVRLEYDFPGADDYVTFQAARPYRIANDRERRFFKVWALGDGPRMNLSAIVTDSEGELWKVFLGEISGTEWQQLQGYIGDVNWPSRVLSSGLSGEVEYPVRLVGFHLDDVDAAFVGAGAIYLDDVTVE